MKNTNWKVPVITRVGIFAIVLMIVFGIQGAQNKAIAYEEQVYTADSDVKVQEKCQSIISGNPVRKFDDTKEN